ncbi:hypothetical protein RF11_09691 [Thelohanellus kitauei]|uniref:Uncharacterized protein n=1 Tax=Thelohanellus kitauei TaxID=669202 RepID=A0A0C2JM18_THEKT|nr:hypothetical protein RF11_09691 [Thelohanellus kitauei]
MYSNDSHSKSLTNFDPSDYFGAPPSERKATASINVYFRKIFNDIVFYFAFVLFLMGSFSSNIFIYRKNGYQINGGLYSTCISLPPKLKLEVKYCTDLITYMRIGTFGASFELSTTLKEVTNRFRKNLSSTIDDMLEEVEKHKNYFMTHEGFKRFENNFYFYNRHHTIGSLIFSNLIEPIRMKYWSMEEQSC